MGQSHHAISMVNDIHKSLLKWAKAIIQFQCHIKALDISINRQLHLNKMNDFV